jgi:hypothetical protein
LISALNTKLAKFSPLFTNTCHLQRHDLNQRCTARFARKELHKLKIIVPSARTVSW